MATSFHFPLTILLVLLLLTLPLKSAAGGIAVYWGQNDNEGKLTDTCNSGLYKYVNLAFLYNFGYGQSPRLNLASHCDPPSGGCKGVSNGIRACQSRGIKVFLSLGGAVGNYGFSTADEARGLAQYLWDNYLGGQSGNRPLGDASLDGIDLDIERGSSQYYADLVGRLTEIGQQHGKKVYFSAAPQCPFPDQSDDPVLRTGLIDFVWIQFYNNKECEFKSGIPGDFQNSWRKWTSSIPARKFFVGLTASPAGDGYVPSALMKSQLLPFVQQSGDKYGGVMLWDRGNDIESGYSSKIIGSV
ncbi:hypothetical protein Droror1_Dr00004623 [Drosera rotundifolia]